MARVLFDFFRSIVFRTNFKMNSLNIRSPTYRGRPSHKEEGSGHSLRIQVTPIRFASLNFFVTFV